MRHCSLRPARWPLRSGQGVPRSGSAGVRRAAVARPAEVPIAAVPVPGTARSEAGGFRPRAHLCDSRKVRRRVRHLGAQTHAEDTRDFEAAVVSRLRRSPNVGERGAEHGGGVAHEAELRRPGMTLKLLHLEYLAELTKGVAPGQNGFRPRRTVMAQERVPPRPPSPAQWPSPATIQSAPGPALHASSQPPRHGRTSAPRARPRSAPTVSESIRVERSRSAISPFTYGDLSVHDPDLGVHHGDLAVHDPPISPFTIPRCVHCRLSPTLSNRPSPRPPISQSMHTSDNQGARAEASYDGYAELSCQSLSNFELGIVAAT